MTNEAEQKVSPDLLEINRLAFEQGAKALEAQSHTLEGLRQRAAALVAIAGLSGTFLGGQALKSPAGGDAPSLLFLGPFEWAATGSLILTVVSAIQIIRARPGWIFFFAPTEIIDQFGRGEHATTLCHTYEVLARFAEENRASNTAKLRPLFWWLSAGLLGLVLQLYFWLVAIAA